MYDESVPSRHRPRVVLQAHHDGHLNVWPEEFGASWSEYPGIERWLERIRAQPGWVYPYQLMPGHPLPEK